MACVYALFCTMVIYKEYKWRDLPKLVHRVTKTVAMVMMVIGFAAGFGYLMAIMQLPAKATALFLSITNDKYAMLLMINILLLLLGTFMDMAPMILICTPIMLPVVKAMGVDPVHFGMIMLLNLGIGFITPPVGPTLFVGCAIGKVTRRCRGALAVLWRHVRRAADRDLLPWPVALVTEGAGLLAAVAVALLHGGEDEVGAFLPPVELGEDFHFMKPRVPGGLDPTSYVG